MTLCHCGLPLHYSNPEVQRLMEEMIARLGWCLIVTVGQRSYAIPRHYIALHGLVAETIPSLGFEEVVKS